jgi:hypothetical protein
MFGVFSTGNGNNFIVLKSSGGAAANQTGSGLKTALLNRQTLRPADRCRQFKDHSLPKENREFTVLYRS